MSRRGAHTLARTSVVWRALDAALAARAHPAGLHILDAGGGTGGFAVPLAELGHHVTVLDPSPDSLASLDRRAADAGVSTVRGVQGSLDDFPGDDEAPDGYDAVLCHRVLEVVDDPAAAVATIVAITRRGGVVSVLATNRMGAVLARALAGRFDDADRLLVDPAGHGGEGDAVLRRFDVAELTGLLTGAGLTIETVHGARIFPDLVPGALVESDAAHLDALLTLEAHAAEHAAFIGIAGALHVLATRP